MPMWDEHVVKMVRMNILYIKHYILNNPAIFLRAGDCGSAFFSLMLLQDLIYLPAMLLQDLIYMHTSKFHPAGVTRNKT